MRDFVVRFAAAFLATPILAPYVGALLPTVPFHRVMTRIFLVSLVIAFLVGRGAVRTWPGKLRAMGLRGPDRRRRLLLGAGVAILVFAALLFVSWAAGGRTPPEQPYRLAWPAHLVKAAATGLVVAFLEEILCRGYLKDAVGGAMSALLYAAAHYFKPLAGSAPAGEGLDPLLGFRRLPEMFQAWSEPRHFTLGLSSLLVFGLALNRLRERTGTLYLGIGVHAGLVFAIDFFRRLLDPTPSGSVWIFGGSRLHDGVLGTAALALLYLAACRIPLPRNTLAAGSD